MYYDGLGPCKGATFFFVNSQIYVKLDRGCCESLSCGLTAVNCTPMDHKYVFIVEAIKFSIDNNYMWKNINFTWIFIWLWITISITTPWRTAVPSSINASGTAIRITTSRWRRTIIIASETLRWQASRYFLAVLYATWGVLELTV